ncbi:MAG: LTA synthase family protein [Bilifractor sp.]
MSSRWKNIDRDRMVRIMNRFAVPLQALWCCILYFIIEWISRHSFINAWEYMTGSPLVFLYNVFLIFMTMSVAFLFRRRAWVRVFVSGFWFVVGLANGIVLANRVTPFTWQDMKLLGDAKKIVTEYIPPVLFILMMAALAAGVFGLVRFFFGSPKYQGKRNWFVDILIPSLSIALFAFSTVLGLHTRVLSSYFGNLAMSYQNYGFPYCFCVTVFDTGMSKPNGYSEKLVHYIEKDEDEKLSGKNDADTKATDTNIIFLQLESFFDPETVVNLKISEDPIPYFHKLQKEYSSGMLKVPVVGAGTVNTEFEAITGMSLAYFGAGEYPYKTVLKQECVESIPFDLKKLGYTTHAIHDNEASFYGRNAVYPNLGFDTFTSEEYMPDVSDVTETGWVKDHILTDEIMKALKSTKGSDYIYTVSVQGHGAYPTEPVISDPEITVTGAENKEQNDYSWEYYCKQIHEMDQFVQKLTETLSDYDEPVVLVMYGDHLPTMGLKQSDVEGWNLYKTPYIIWDNFGLKEQDKDIAAYQIGAEVLKRIGIYDGTLVRYHEAERGDRYYQSNLEIMQYDMLYGDKYVYNGTSPFTPTDMQMGVVPISVSRVRKVGTDEDSIYYIYGQNFTAASRLMVNDKMINKTVFVNNGLLLVNGLDIADTDQISIAQKSNTSNEILSSTEQKPLSDYLEK